MIIDPDKCRGNQMCMAACPYENVIYFNDALNIAQKCTFCAHLLDDGWTEPRCADACPTGAFTFGDEDDPEDQGADRQGRAAQAGARHVKPRVYYIGLPKKFIAGAVFDQEADECLEGVTVTATNNETGEKAKATDRQLRRLLAAGPQERRLHAAHREVRLPGAEGRPGGRDQEGHERRRHRHLEGVTPLGTV